MILGPSGTGKSVCIKHIVGLLYPDQGDVIVHGQLDPQPARRRPVRAAQEVRRAVPGRRPVRLAEPLRQRRLPAAPAHREGRGGDRRDRQPPPARGRAGGRRTRRCPTSSREVCASAPGFARALVLEPDIVLFDEPDSGLDPVRTALLCELIKEVHAENGGCYVVITHDIMSARRVAEHISVLWKGRSSSPARRRSCSPRKTRSCASSSRASRPARSAWSDAARRWARGAASLHRERVALLARWPAAPRGGHAGDRARGRARAGGAVLALRLQPDGGDEHASSRARARSTGPPQRFYRELRRRAGRGARQGQPRSSSCSARTSTGCSAWRDACRATSRRARSRRRAGRTGRAGSSRARAP